MSDARPDTSEAAGTDWLATLREVGHETRALTADEQEIMRRALRRSVKIVGEGHLVAALRALLAERDAALSARDDAIRRLGDAARDAGRWRGISDGKEILIKHLTAERDALRAQRDSLRDALEKALEWIEGWDPGFTMEPDWPADHAAMRGVLATLREAGHE